MVKIAIAGGSGQVAREVIDALLRSKTKHEITILSRKRSPSTNNNANENLTWRTVDYHDKSSLAAALRGTHTLLSFVQLLSDPGQMAQRNLIDAAVQAGVRRFAPSEWGSKGTTDMPWWDGKERIREYLKEVNKDEEILEYTLFQPGLFLNYLAFPHQTATHLQPLQTVFDVENRRAILVHGHEDAVMTLTTVADLAGVVVRAVEYEEGRWPVEGGVVGNRVRMREVVEVAERVRGAPFTVDKVHLADLEAGTLNTSWSLEATHSSIPADEAAAMLKRVAIGILVSSAKGAWDSTDGMSGLFADYRFTGIEEFLEGVWGR
ncbi:hypothetical protein FQN50_003060 [Emmonsiellopsis sp. PD_5]|nr:hypothetical protein FQN50_003060 [Emmonsiellopsis sp. PD_5]